MSRKTEGFKIAGAVELTENKKLPDWLIAEEKLDGVRTVIVMEDGKGTAYTRNGVKMVNADHIISELESFPDSFANCMIDGEAVIFNKDGSVDWNTTLSVCNTQKKHPRAKDLQWRTFDYLTLAEWKSRKGIYPLTIRKKKLAKRIKRLKSKRISVIKYELIKGTWKSVRKFFKECLKNHHEGSIFKKHDSIYSFRKNNDWWKMKPYLENDFKIVGMKPGKEGKTGQMLGLIGSLDCAGKIGTKKITFNASGMNMDLRKQMTELHKKKKLVGKIVEVRHEGVTVNNKVRFPRFIRLRLDK
jgi:ATP-dependent DNA ligase